jgi:hypothetical protein
LNQIPEAFLVFHRRDPCNVIFPLQLCLLQPSGRHIDHASGAAGPVGHGWYVLLDRLACNRFRVGSPSFIATKVVLDEGLFGPIHVLGFFAYMTLVEGGTWEVRCDVILLPGFQEEQN